MIGINDKKEMEQKELSIRFCGIAGDGIVSSGKILAGACAAFGLEVMVNDIYSAEIRGLGKSTTTVRFSNSKVYSMGDGIDLLVGLASKDSISELKDVRHGGSVFYDSSTPGEIKEEESLAAHIPPQLNGFAIPFKLLANEASGSTQGKNIVAMGALCHLYSLPKAMFLNQIKTLFARKGEKVLAVNNKAFHLGYDYCKKHYPLNRHFQIAEGLKPKRLSSGNESIFKGALHSGLKYFAGYPITPATKIMEMAARELPKREGWCHQAEDEIAAISAVVGGGFAGRRSMTATSGPGLALMSEMLNLAVMAEIPTVVINVQRGGPSTGLPTKVEQGDLNIAMYGGSGDSPRVVMAASSSEECYTGIKLAFDLAEKYQTPVIFLSDLFLGQRTETVEITEKDEPDRCTRKKPTAEQLEEYLRFRITDDGVSPLIVPGEEGAYYTVTGLEHTIKGTPNYESEVHRMMTDKRYRKFEAMLADIPPADVIGDEDAEIGIATWGSSLGAIIEAMELVREKGIKVKTIHSVMIYPQHKASFQAFFDSCKRIIIPEMNYEGQYAALMKSRYGIKPVEMHIPSVNPVSPLKIAEKIMEVNRELTK